MAELWQDLVDKIKGIGANWPVYTVVGSFALYLLGYLSLRFHLTALGISTDLTVLDERYLFTGARCLIYMVSSIPTLLLVILFLLSVIAFFALISYLPYRILSGGIRERIAAKWTSWWTKIRDWATTPNRWSLFGIIFSLFMIQFVMRKCFFLSNLLLREKLPPQAGWLNSLLLTRNEGLMALYFSGLIGGCIISGGFFFFLHKQTSLTTLSRLLKGILAFLMVVQFLLLPVNYGYLIVDKSMPRVADLGGIRTLKEKEEAWLVWEGKEGITYLIQKKKGEGVSKSLITLPREDIKEIEVVAYERILPVLYGK
ncbi:MAG: hypothetical protein ACMUHX_04545 [bacterium]